MTGQARTSAGHHATRSIYGVVLLAIMMPVLEISLIVVHDLYLAPRRQGSSSHGFDCRVSALFCRGRLLCVERKYALA
jgi:hypothetical protein